MSYSKLQADEAKEYLLKICKEYDVGIDQFTESFYICSGSSSPDKHHYGKYGLIIHTAEVLQLCLSTIKTLNLKMNMKCVILSVIFHDSGKTLDYSFDDAKNEWVTTDHKNKIHHISRSAIFFNEYSANRSDLSREQKDEILHAILSHHGSREWGSPVKPQTKLAWLLHLCDGLSARLNDTK